MQVILIQDVNNLGGTNELITVKNGYGRNYLIPQKFAVEASPSNVKMMEERKKQQAKKEAKLLAELNSVIAVLNNGALKIGAKTGYVKYSWDLNNKYTYILTDTGGIATTTSYQR